MTESQLEIKKLLTKYISEIREDINILDVSVTELFSIYIQVLGIPYNDFYYTLDRIVQNYKMDNPDDSLDDYQIYVITNALDPYNFLKDIEKRIFCFGDLKVKSQDRLEFYQESLISDMDDLKDIKNNPRSMTECLADISYDKKVVSAEQFRISMYDSRLSYLNDVRGRILNLEAIRRKREED